MLATGSTIWYDLVVNTKPTFNRRMERIDGQKHPVIQKLRELQTEKGRIEHNAFHVEGSMVVSRALDYGCVEFIICTDRFPSTPGYEEILAAAQESGAGIFAASEGLIAKIVPCKPTPPVIACVERKIHSPESLLDKTEGLILLVDKCENPDNLGMLLRSLDAAGVDGVVLTSDGVDPFNRLSVRASRGSVLSLDLAVADQPENWLEEAQKRGFRIVASSAHGATDIWDIDFRGPTIVVVGNEHTGVRESIRKMADSYVVIPMVGKMESLNIAVSGAILAYEAARQRR